MSQFMFPDTDTDVFAPNGDGVEVGRKSSSVKVGGSGALDREHAAWIAHETFNYPIGSPARKYPFAFALIGLGLASGGFWALLAVLIF